MPIRIRIFVFVSLLAVALFVRLGAWQVGRLNERRASNTRLFERRSLAPTDVRALVPQPERARFRAVTLRGRYDYANQFRWTARSRSGAPGVVFLTPVHPESGGDAVLVHRGWVYAADGMTVDDSLWQEGDSAIVEGWADTWHVGTGPVQVPSVPRGVRRLAFDSLQALLPYRIAPLYVVQQIGAGIQDTIRHPHRLDRPTLDEGPHRGYALQWFAFAAITVMGTVAVVARERQGSRT